MGIGPLAGIGVGRCGGAPLTVGFVAGIGVGRAGIGVVGAGGRGRGVVGGGAGERGVVGVAVEAPRESAARVLPLAALPYFLMYSCSAFLDANRMMSVP